MNSIEEKDKYEIVPNNVSVYWIKDAPEGLVSVVHINSTKELYSFLSHARTIEFGRNNKKLYKFKIEKID